MTAAEDFLGAGWEFGGCVVVVGAVADVVADDPLGFGVVAFGGGDGGEVEAGYLFVGRGEGCGFGGHPGEAEVSGGEGVGGDHVGDVDYGDGEVLVDAVALE